MHYYERVVLLCLGWVWSVQFVSRFPWAVLSLCLCTGTCGPSCLVSGQSRPHSGQIPSRKLLPLPKTTSIRGPDNAHSQRAWKATRKHGHSHTYVWRQGCSLPGHWRCTGTMCKCHSSKSSDFRLRYDHVPSWYACVFQTRNQN